MPRIVLFTALNIALVAAFPLLLYTFAPVKEPIIWEAPYNPGFKGQYEANEALGATAVIQPKAIKPEDSTTSPDGLIYVGVEGGNIIRFSPKDTNKPFEIVANTGGRPLGLRFAPDGTLFVADAYKGLLAIDRSGNVTVATDSVSGKKMMFVDHLDVASDGTVWFSDASTKYSYDEYMKDYLEGSQTGRLLKYSPTTQKTEVVLEDIKFSNGVAVGPNDEYVLVVEGVTGSVQRYWLKGPDAGKSDVFIDQLPGIVDNIYFDEEGILWLAMPSERQPLDKLSAKPVFRRILSSAPSVAKAFSKSKAIVFGLDESGAVKFNLQSEHSDYHTITGVNRVGDTLFLTSLEQNGIGIFELHPNH